MHSDVKATTILAVSRNGRTALGGDGQVTLGNSKVKTGAKKVRKIGEGKVLAGFAGTAADALGLLERLEGHLKSESGDLRRAAVSLAKEWRTDRVLRRLEAMLLTADAKSMLIVSGSGDVIEPDVPVAAVGSGADAARAAALALIENTNLSAVEIVRKALNIASRICIYTNDNLTVEEL